MPKLSLCLIARDEEQMLVGCLASVRGVVDEIVLVDTGSVDRTAEVAREAGATVASVPWEDDFAQARNASLALATGDWVLQLDADERLVRAGASALRASLERTDFDCGLVRLHNASRLASPEARVLAGAERLGDPQRLPRLFRRDEGLRYVGAIHESVDDWLAARGMRVRFLDVDVVHLGRTEEVVRGKGKSERNLRMLRAICAKEQLDYTHHGYLAHELLGAGLDAEAAEVVEAGFRIVLAGTAPRHRSVLRLAIARAMVALSAKDPARALETLDVAERLDGPHPDVEHLRGLTRLSMALSTSGAARVAEAERATAAHRRARSFSRRTFVQQYFEGATSHVAWLQEGVAQLVAARPKDALAAFDAALAARPGLREASLGRAEALLDLGRIDPALATLAPLLDDRPDGWLLAAACAERSASATDVVLFMQNVRQRLSSGLWSPHLRERLGHLLCAADAYAGAPHAGPGVTGALTALMAREPATPHAIDRVLVERMVVTLVRAGRVEQVVPLLEPPAEIAIPGLPALVRKVLGGLGLSVVDDGT